MTGLDIRQGRREVEGEGGCHLFFNGEEADDVVVVEFAENFKLAHLNSEWSQVTDRVEDLYCVQLARFLHDQR